MTPVRLSVQAEADRSRGGSPTVISEGRFGDGSPGISEAEGFRCKSWLPAQAGCHKRSVGSGSGWGSG